MAQELTFNITEDTRRLKRPTTVKDFKLSFGHADQGPTDVVIGDDGNIVQGRYGDSARQVFVNVVQGENNEPVDITGYLPEFNGCIPDAEHIVIDNWDGVLVDPRHGRFRFDFPIQAFTVAGSYKQAYFRLVQNGTGKTLATLEFDMQVLEDFVYSNIVPQDYVTPYLDMINKLKDAYTNFVSKTQDSFDQAKKRLDDIMSTVEDKADTVEQRLKIDEQALTELSKKIDEKGLFTEDEAKQFEDLINNKLADVQAETKKLKESLSGAGFIVNDYGAKADGETDDTAAIQKAIDTFANSKSSRLVFSGTYKVSKTAIDDDKRPYAIKFAGLSHKTIDLTNAQFKTDMVDNFPSILAFYNCTDIYVIGGYAEAVNFNMTQQHDLYSGAFVYAHGCTNLSVYHTSTFNMMYNTCIFESSDGVISGTKFNHDLSSKEWKLRPCSAVLLYDGAKYHVQDNIIYGGLRDGDLSIFGGKTYGNTVTNNYLQALNYFSEGITVDGGACKTIVSNNILNGYNYAIDVKFNSENTLVNGNTIEKSTVAISDRGGEINSNAHVFQTIIANNNIVFGDLPESEQPELGKLGLNGFHQVGINIDKEFTADIHGNHLTLGRDYDVNYKIVGIMVNAQSGEGQPDFVSPINITGNFLELKNGIDGFYQEAGDGSSCVYLNSVRQGNISNNSIKSDKNNSYVDIVGNNGTLTFSGNSFTSSSNVPIKYGDGATCNHLIINNNNLMEGFVEITNAPKYQVGTQYNNKQYVAKNIDFTNNTTTPFLIISAMYSRSVLLKVDMTYDYNGTFVVSSVYRIYIDTNSTKKEGDYTSIEAITQNDKDTELSIVRIDGNSIGLQAKPTRENYEKAVATFHITILDNATDVWFN
ncbi:BppU family phage baseplate upper protein [Limosilactobacillus reuteri]|uniref:BppU family phage baseplate upper protein n=1 Tax=Limosilactobacillus reuteri TaxID=1598 RepID=UPI0024B87E97|nr:BppU family phage baseplate upper protein [Limosilactobacillus reuteri]